MNFYAHSKPGRPETEWQPLREHLVNVAEKAREFADAFGAGNWGHLAGLWHDLGKYSAEFQAYLRANSDLCDKIRFLNYYVSILKTINIQIKQRFLKIFLNIDIKDFPGTAS